MKKTKFTESQIIKILKEQESRKSVADICREHGISLRRMKELEAELAQYKRIVAEQTLQLTVLKDVIEKNRDA